MEHKQGLFFTEAAKKWTEAAPIGNGHIGAMVHGGVSQEVLCLNDDALWSGYFRDTQKESFAEDFQQVRILMKAGKRKEAQDFIEAKLLGPFSQVYLPLGDIIMSFDQQDGEHYSRQLDFETAIADTEYSCGSTKIRRRCYCSCPDDVLVYEIISSNPISFTIQMTSQLHHEVVYTTNGIHMTGKAPDNIVIADVYHFFEGQNTISYDAPDKGTDFCAQLRLETDGNVSGDTALRISGCTRAVLYYTSATSYRYKECAARCSDVLDRAEKKGAVRIFDDHRADFGELYNRVDLSLDAPTVVSTRGFFSPGNEGAKISTLFQYGRYLTISGSRAGTLPNTLQGIWNQDLIPPWWSSYTLNINLEMNYWPVWKANLAECALPLFDFVELLQKRGTETAKSYGMHGFVVHHQTDAWGLSTPVGGGQGPIPDSASWGCWYMSAVWLSTQLLDGWRYTGNRQLLLRAYNLMAGVAAFLEDVLVEEDGYLTTSPSTSPENLYLDSEGNRMAVCGSCAMDIGLLNEFYAAYALAADALEKPQIARQARDNQAKLPPYLVEDGRLQEWDANYRETEPGHRHFSMLYGIYPGSHLLKELKAPAWQSFTRRLENGGGSTGWSAAWAIALAARFGEGTLAGKMIGKLIAEELHPNLFGAHPPDFFQIDTNFGFTSAICELLIQEYDGVIHPLLSMPESMQIGAVTGLVCQGGHIISMNWNRQTVSITLLAGSTGTVRLALKDAVVHPDTVPRTEPVVTLPVRAGQHYEISGRRS